VFERGVRDSSERLSFAFSPSIGLPNRLLEDIFFLLPFDFGQGFFPKISVYFLTNGDVKFFPQNGHTNSHIKFQFFKSG
jgi:hypothetical protein